MQGLFPLFLWIPRYTAVYSVWTEFLLVRRKLSKENSCSWALLFNAQNIPNFEFDLTILFVTEPVLLMNLAHTGRHSPLNLDSQTSEEKGNAVTHLPAHSPLLFLSATWKPACSQVTPPKPLSYQHNSKRPLWPFAWLTRRSPFSAIQWTFFNHAWWAESESRVLPLPKHDKKDGEPWFHNPPWIVAVVNNPVFWILMSPHSM